MSKGVGFIDSDSDDRRIGFIKYSADKKRSADGKHNRYGWNVDINIEWAEKFLSIWKFEYKELIGFDYHIDEYDIELNSNIYGICHSLSRQYIICMPKWSNVRAVELIRTYHEFKQPYQNFTLEDLVLYASFYDDFILLTKLINRFNKLQFPYFIDIEHFEKIYNATSSKHHLLKYYGHLIYDAGQEKEMLNNKFNGKYKYLSAFIPPVNIFLPDELKKMPHVVLHGVADLVMRNSLGQIFSMPVPEGFDAGHIGKVVDPNNMNEWDDKTIESYFGKWKEDMKNNSIKKGEAK